MRILFAVMLALVAGTASAATYYVADCGTGADVACVAGSDAADGTIGTPFQTSAKIQALFIAAQPGDQILLAKGGAWNSVAMSVYNTYAGTSAANLEAMRLNPVILDSYTPSWGAGTAKPILNGSSTETALYFYHGSPDKLKSGGHIIRNISFKSLGYYNNAATGAQRYGKYIAYDNITVDGFAAGVTCGGQVGYGQSSHVSVTNSTFTNNAKIAILMSGCSGVLIDGNTMDNNGFDDSQLTAQDVARNHSMYISGTDFNDGSIATDIIIRNNTVTRNSICPAVGTNGYNAAHTCLIGTCSSSILVGHDWASDMVIEGNHFSNATSETDLPCYGIDYRPANGGYSEATFRLVVRGNIITNPGGVGMVFGACQSCVVENNVIIWEAAAATANGGEMRGIWFKTNPVSASPGTTYQNTAATVRNNTIYYDHTSAASTAIEISDEGTAHKVVSNLIYFNASGTNTGAYCFSISGLTIPTNFAQFNNNLCSHAASWTATQSLATWQGTAGSPDANSTTSAPVLVGVPSQANPSYAGIQTTSPAKNAGHASASSRLSIHGYPAVGTRDIGAYEFGSNP